MISEPRAAWSVGCVLVMVLAAGAIACGDASSTRGAGSATGVGRQQLAELQRSQDDLLPPGHDYLFACDTDSDCVAVPRAGLCRNGLKEAVNRHHIEAYRDTLANRHRGACTFLLIRDRRVAHCDEGARRCMLRLPPPRAE